MTTVTRPIHFARQCRRKRAVVGPEPAPAQPAGRVPRVARLMALAIRFDDLLQRGEVPNQSDLARLCQVTQPRMTQIMNLLHLAPDIQEEILFLPPVEQGRDSIHEHMLRQVTACDNWKGQRSRWTLLKRRTEYPGPA